MRYETWMTIGFPSDGNETNDLHVLQSKAFLSIQRMLVRVQTSEFQQWTEESKMELESSCFDEMVKGVLTSSMGNEDACNSRK